MEQSLDYSLTMSGELPDTSKLVGTPSGNPDNKLSTPLSKTAPASTPASAKSSASKFLQMAAASFDEDKFEASGGGGGAASPGGGGVTPLALKHAASVVDSEASKKTPRGDKSETKRAMMLAAGRVERDEHREVAMGLKKVPTARDGPQYSGKMKPKLSRKSYSAMVHHLPLAIVDNYKPAS